MIEYIGYFLKNNGFDLEIFKNSMILKFSDNKKDDIIVFKQKNQIIISGPISFRLRITDKVSTLRRFMKRFMGTMKKIVNEFKKEIFKRLIDKFEKALKENNFNKKIKKFVSSRLISITYSDLFNVYFDNRNIKISYNEDRDLKNINLKEVKDIFIKTFNDYLVKKNFNFNNIKYIGYNNNIFNMYF